MTATRARLITGLVVAGLSIVSAQTTPFRVGETLPAWTVGTLDIHQDASRTPGQWIARYVRQMMSGESPRLDYAVLTHFHPDHMGRIDGAAAIGARADQVASGHGHVVVRVEPGGERYRVVVLDDTTESYRITSVHGPYASR